MHVLHLVQPWERTGAGGGRGDDAGVLACRSVLKFAKHHTHSVCLIGGTLAAVRAARLGLRTDDRIAPALGKAVLGWPALRRLVERGPRPDIVQSWSEGLAPLSARVFGARTPVFEPPPLLRDPGSAWLPPACGVSREETRAELGIKPDEGVVLLACDPPHEADAVESSFVAGMLGITGTRVVALMPKGARSLDRVAHMRDTSRTRMSYRLMTPELPVYCLLAAADLAVNVRAAGAGNTGGAPPAPHVIAAAHRAGVPVIVDDPPSGGRWYGEAYTDCRPCASHAGAAAGICMTLLERPAERQRIARIVREVARACGEPDAIARAVESAWSARLAQCHGAALARA